MACVQFKNIVKKFKENLVLDGINLEIKDHEFVVIVGPSGCGKTTLLRMLAGLEEVTDGEIRIDNLLVNELHPSKRQIAMVFQDYALYPHMTVAENMSFSLRLKKVGRAEISARVKEAAQTLQLEKFLLRMPRQLSGGQRQRVAIGRAIVRKPKVFLFDEPLSNLDAKLREGMRVEIAKLYQRLNSTIIYVTHDQVEAMTLAGRIVVMNRGVIQQVGSPIEVYRKPENLFVAGFIGSPTMNFIAGRLSMSGGKAVFKGGDISINVPGFVLGGAEAIDGREVVLGIRPDDVLVGARSAEHCSEKLQATLEVCELLGHRENLYLQAGQTRLVATVEAFFNQSPGSAVPFCFNYANMHFFDKLTEKRIG
ncbi:MAG: glycerol-3-phosphate ABC transporter ATP-binding protein [Elusimicrobia bacterium GWC2_51_8]|nr:MAG: glycerol-3-phosphate ABC transporter ATP-binding protein [Elusimicrobia bacterium GWA2_51_34]OGR66002.1 MAG: glycerol-3-phosphate ABC transporter ATP-binding protein [Elusimicrobia bacterium GWC2_51_8]OGR87199.1 MAG: glycerol-3-phosphate ABC transporter ATP-binding protein [Elusimicrobia bacterium GWF2_52_66]HAF94909.1 glycerol-3-phosphate ABC transporter ATP-binding protein [Elusimicrobiota bacterium]HCE97517.1 glycerol-3-phosphate ABC transporter ATP-binding protein [Elusimicrobiota b